MIATSTYVNESLRYEKCIKQARKRNWSLKRRHFYLRFGCVLLLAYVCFWTGFIWSCLECVVADCSNILNKATA